MPTLPQLEADLRTIYRGRTRESERWYARAISVMPGGDTRAGTFHLPYPIFMDRGAGARVWDIDGNEYWDFLNNFTSLIHGHAHPAVTAALTAQAQRGTVLGSACVDQVRLAERIEERMPDIERLRFCNSGTEATLFALRAAKAFTGKSKILKMEGGYHGSHDQVSVGMVSPFERTGVGLSPGATSEVLLGSFNELDVTSSVIRQYADELAAVIVEPVMGAAGGIPAEPEFLHGLRKVASECGVLLILDEIITFRLSYGGAQTLYGIRPDLTTFGKVIGGGLPIGAFGGRADVMATFDPTRPGTVSHSGTYNGNAVTMAAGVATLEAYGRDEAERVNNLGDELRTELNAIIRRLRIPAIVVGLGSVMQLHFMEAPVRNARDAARANKAALQCMHLGMLIRGFFTTSRQMYVLSTVMDDADIRAFASGFEDSIVAVRDALNPGPMAGSVVR
ncbi:MAG: aspartate aminotransferase family protein [Gemmatimonadota bacterium]